MKDIVVASHLKSFVESFGLLELEESEQFERFCFYSLLNNQVSRPLNTDDLEAVSVGENKGIDGIAFVINGELIKDIETLEVHKESKTKMDISLYFFQAKTSAKFDDARIGGFLDTIIDFLEEDPDYAFTPEAGDLHQLFLAIFEDIGLVKNYELHAYYCSTGSWSADATIGSTIEKKRDIISKRGIFNGQEIQPIDRTKILALYKKASNPIEAEFLFMNKIPLH
jgi:hypothetical protein